MSIESQSAVVESFEELKQLAPLIHRLRERLPLSDVQLLRVSEALADTPEPVLEVPAPSTTSAPTVSATTPEPIVSITPPKDKELFADTVYRILGERHLAVKDILKALKAERHKTSKSKAPAQAVARVFRENPNRFERISRGVYRAIIRGVHSVGTMPTKASPKLGEMPALEKQLKALKTMPKTFMMRDFATKLGIHVSQSRGVAHNLHTLGYISTTGKMQAGAVVWRQTKKLASAS